MCLCVRTTTVSIFKVAKIRAMPGMTTATTYVKIINLDAFLLSAWDRYEQITVFHAETVVNLAAARAAPTTQLKTMMPYQRLRVRSCS